MMGLDKAALASGCWRNRERHTKNLSYKLKQGINHLAPSTYDLDCYITNLHRELLSPSTVANAL